MLILLPPSEGKKSGGSKNIHATHFPYALPVHIATHATEKDLKCKGKRYNEAMQLNENIHHAPLLPAIERYTGVMFSAIDYPSMSKKAQTFFDTHVRIVSGLYGLLRPQDQIANYKLPITTKGLYQFRGTTITKLLNKQESELIIDLLPQAHKKVIQRDDINAKVLTVDFFNEGKKLTHGVKGVKGRWLLEICKQQLLDPSKRTTSCIVKEQKIDIVVS